MCGRFGLVRFDAECREMEDEEGEKGVNMHAHMRVSCMHRALPLSHRHNSLARMQCVDVFTRMHTYLRKPTPKPIASAPTGAPGSRSPQTAARSPSAQQRRRLELRRD